MTPLLSELFAAHQGNLSDKWLHYISVYERELARFIAVGAPVDLLEIGVQNGGSLQIWSRYLPAGSRITGLDIDPACAGLALADNVEVLKGNVADPRELYRLLGSRTFDIIIDDGSHRSPDVIAAFDSLFERVNGLGLYIAEDLHCSYRPDFGGGFRSSGTSVEWFKDLVEALNFDHVATTSVPSGEAGRLTRLNRMVGRLSFYDSVAVVEKYATAKEAAFPRVMAGGAMPVADPSAAIWRFMTPEQIRAIYLSASTVKGFSGELTGFVANAKEAVLTARNELAKANAVIADLRRQLAERPVTVERPMQVTPIDFMVPVAPPPVEPEPETGAIRKVFRRFLG